MASLRISSMASRDAFGDAGAERIDRRIIDGDYGDAVFFCELH